MELFDVLDNKGNYTGKTKPRAEVHRDGDWHKAVHIWIMNNRGQVLIQKRSPQKDSHPNEWDISAAGHLSAGETSIGTAIKEMREELGVQVQEADFKYLFTFVSQSVQQGGVFINNEFEDVYLLKLDLDISKLVLQKEEVSEVKWIDQKDLSEVYEKKDTSFVQHQEEYAKLLTFLDDFVGVKIALFIGDKLLVYLRDNKPGLRFAGLWDFPGGGREESETPEETVIREVQEEFSIKLKPDLIMWKKEYPAMVEVGRKAYFCAAKLPQKTIDEIKFGDEGQKWSLMDVNEFLSRNDVVPHLKVRLSDYLQLKGGR